MKIIGILIFLIVIGLSSFGQDYWVQRDSVKGPPRSTCAAFVLNDDAYLVTGLDEFGFKRLMVSYDISQDDWDDELSLGGDFGDGLNRGSAIAFNVGNFGFCGLGTGSADYFKDLWKFDRTLNTWTQVADFQGTARREAIAFTIDNIAYVGTGQDENGLTNDMWKYDHETNDWTQVADFPGSARKDAVGFDMIGQGYVGTGTDAMGYTNDFYAYYPLTDSWQQKADFPGTPRHGSVGFGLFPTAFVGMGEDNTFTFKKDIWEYNYFGDSWTQRTNFPGPARAQAVAVVVQGRAYVGTGFNGTFLDDFYEYVPMLALEDELKISTSIYPIPARTDFTIKTRSQIKSEKTKIFSISGQEITDNFNFQFIDEYTLTVQIKNNLSPGNYLIYLETSQGSCLKKLHIVS